MTRLASRDLRGLLDVVGSIGYDHDADALSHEVLQALLVLLDASWVTQFVTDPRTKRRPVEVRLGAEGLPWTGPWAVTDDDLQAAHAGYPLSGAAFGVHLMWDVSSRRRFLGSEFYDRWCRPDGIVPQGLLNLPDRPGGLERVVMFDRDLSQRSFGERERVLLETMGPYLARPFEAADAVRRRQRAAGLTARELEVLAVVREGRTNGEAAAQLFVSESTVRKHLEHASVKLGAHTRAEAVALAWR